MGKGTIMKPKFPLLVLLGIVFLASASVSFGLAYWEKENPVSHGKCLQSCNKENDVHRYRACQGRCNLIKNPESEEREEREERQESRQPWRERGRQEGEEEEERDPREQPQRRDQEPEQERGGQRERGEEEEEGNSLEKQPHRRHQEQGRERRQGRREEEEESWGQRPQTQREQGRGGSEEEGEEEEREPWRQRPQSQTVREQERQQRGREREQKEEEGEWRGERRREDPEERERMRMRRQKEERGHHREKTEQHEEREEEQGSRSRSRKSNNPFHFSSNRFQTRYRNRNGQIRVLQRFDQRSNKLQNLQNYRIVEYESRPNTLILPHHSDADYILIVLRGRATITVVNPNDKQAYNLERGDALRLPAGTTVYLLNRDNNQNLRVVKLAIPVNKPGQFDDFFPSSTQNQQSYFRGFSKKTLEVAFNTRYKEIQRILLGEEEQEQEQAEQEQQSQEEGVIVRVSKEQIQELSKHAQSSSRKGKPSKSGPFNLRSNKPIYSNRFGNFYEITPEKNHQLQDLELSLSCVEINEGALMLPHYNSKAIVVVVVNEGKGNLELVGLRQQQQQQEQEEQEEEEEEEEGTRQVQRYRAKLSEGDIFVIPAGHPVSVNASSNLHLLGFGINAEDNQRNFLAGEDDNVISQLDRQVKELAFPGSAQDIERLINNQQQSYFANAQPQQREEGRQRRSGPLSSILGAFY